MGNGSKAVTTGLVCGSAPRCPRRSVSLRMAAVPLAGRSCNHWFISRLNGAGNEHMPEEISLRVVLVDPPPGFAFCLQRGKGAKSERLDYLEADGGELNFDLAVAVREGKIKGTPDFAGPFVQGPPGGRFFYLCVGQCAPTVEPHWSGRVKAAFVIDHLGGCQTGARRVGRAPRPVRGVAREWSTGARERPATW